MMRLLTLAKRKTCQVTGLLLLLALAGSGCSKAPEEKPIDRSKPPIDSSKLVPQSTGGTPQQQQMREFARQQAEAALQRASRKH